jgi:hypothetical protein
VGAKPVPIPRPEQMLVNPASHCKRATWRRAWGAEQVFGRFPLSSNPVPKDRTPASHGAARSISTFAELHQLLPSLSRYQLQTLLRELKNENKIRSVGRTKGGRWHPVEAAE